MNTSDMPFAVGHMVYERIGEGEHATQEMVKITAVTDDLCQTSTGYWYSRATGGREPKKLDGSYRAIHSVGYAG